VISGGLRAHPTGYVRISRYVIHAKSAGCLLRRLIIPLDRFLHQAHSDRLGGDPDPADLAVDHSANLLDIGLEFAFGNAGNLLTHATEVLGLTAPSYALTGPCLLSCKIAFSRHLLLPSVNSQTPKNACALSLKTDLLSNRTNISFGENNATPKAKIYRKNCHIPQKTCFSLILTVISITICPFKDYEWKP